MDAEATLTGAQGAAWLIPEPHPGHVLVQCTEPVDGRSWFLLSVDIEPFRVVLRGVKVGHVPADGVELELVKKPLVVVQVPDAVHLEDFVQMPGELARAIVRGLLTPSAGNVVQWKTAVARLLAVVRRRRTVGAARAVIRQERTANKLNNQRRADAARRRKKRKGR